MTDTLRGLIERLEKLEGPSTEANADILEATGGCAHRETEYYCIEDGNDYDSGFTCKRCHEDTYGQSVPPYTASLDAAVALVERVLPGWRVENLCEWDADVLRQRGPWTCDLMRRGKDFADHFPAKCAHAPTPAIALLIATLKALQENSNER
ncbi:hypothetical protein ACHMW7_15980 [Aminobacter sp. UC22_36]|uniref:hypothetical protein n=1 Tax=Aminobacter sp. UC22_36 TaxID=3374549 RepID=UPI0037577499